MAKRLIVNADDFGISAGVNRGILETHNRGIVTSTSLMCHPDYIEDLNEPYANPREVELQLLTNPKIRELIEAQNIELISFAEL